jgi:hypothetical protein
MTNNPGLIFDLDNFLKACIILIGPSIVFRNGREENLHSLAWRINIFAFPDPECRFGALFACANLRERRIYILRLRPT